eukprot:15166812-Alexandrium_andersonii.AAC.1
MVRGRALGTSPQFPEPLQSPPELSRALRSCVWEHCGDRVLARALALAVAAGAASAVGTLEPNTIRVR